MPSSAITAVETDGTSVKVSIPLSELVPSTTLTLAVRGASGTFGLSITDALGTHSYGPFAMGCVYTVIQAALDAAHSGVYAIKGGPFAFQLARSDGGVLSGSVDTSGLSASYAAAPFTQASGSNLASSGTFVEVNAFTEQNGGTGHFWSAENWAVVNGDGGYFLEGPAPSAAETWPGMLEIAVPAVGYYQFRRSNNTNPWKHVLTTTAATIVLYDGDPRSGGVIRAVLVDDQTAVDPHAKSGDANYTVASGALCIASGALWYLVCNDGDGVHAASIDTASVVGMAVGSTPDAVDPAITPAATVSVVGTAAASGGVPVLTDGANSTALDSYYWDGNGVTYLIDQSRTLRSIGPSDSATVAFPAGWGVTASGAEPAQSAVAVTMRPLTNGLWRSFNDPVDMTAPRNMKLGYNLPLLDYYTMSIYSNLFKSSSGWMAPGGVTIATDSDGQLTSTSGGEAYCDLTLVPDTYITPDGGVACGGWGHHALVFTSVSRSATARIDTNTGDVSTLFSTETLASGPWSGATRVIYNVQPGGSALNAPGLRAHATGDCHVLGCFRPGLAADGTDPMFDPNFTACIPPGLALRTGGFGPNVNPGCATEYSDFVAPTFLSYNSQSYFPTVVISAISIDLTGISGASAAAAAYFPGSAYPFAITVSSTAAFRTGDTVMLQRFSGAGTLGITQDVGGTPTFWDLQVQKLTVLVFDSTTLIAELVNRHPNLGATNTGTSIVQKLRYGGPAEDMITLFRQIPTSVVHLQVPIQLSDAGCDEWFGKLADLSTGLPAGMILEVEPGNETWNDADPYYLGKHWLEYEAVRRSLSISTYQMLVLRGSEMVALAKAAWTAAGRDPADVLFYVNVADPANSSQPLSDALGYADAHSTDIDIVGIAIYESPFGLVGGGDWLLPEHVLAVLEHQAGAWAVHVNSGSSALIPTISRSTHNPGAKAELYEGGPAHLQLTGSGSVAALQAQGAAFHPRAYQWFLRILKSFDDAGLHRLNKNSMSETLSNDAGNGTGLYAALLGWNMLPGIGDGSDGRANNLPEIAAAVAGTRSPRYQLMSSPIAAAVRDYAAPAVTITRRSGGRRRRGRPGRAA
jgi:hypothetical protein